MRNAWDRPFLLTVALLATALALAASASLLSAGAMVVSILSEASRLRTDVMVFTSEGSGRSVASGGLGPGVISTVVCSVAATIVAGAAIRATSRPARL